jgi:vacuolar-type H+-ATPase subunit E/Vma4
LTHLDEWLSHLTWLQSLGNMQPLLIGVRPAKIKHLAEEAQSLHATNLGDFSTEKHLALLVCLIQSAQISTRDKILQMFTKRLSRITTRAKEELERVRNEERGMAEHLVEVFADVLAQALEKEDPAKTMGAITEVLEREGVPLCCMNSASRSAPTTVTATSPVSGGFTVRIARPFSG